MKINSADQSVFDYRDVFELMYTNDLDILENIVCESSQEIDKLESFANFKFKKINFDLIDQNLQKTWLMPAEYQNMDIEEYLVNLCPKENYQRLIEELQEFRKRNMLDLLRWLKYLVDICRKNNIVWGVGRGSSVASYTLYLLGVHKINSVKYNLSWHDFLR